MGMHHCDVLIAIGARFDDRITGDLAKFCPHAKIIHIDVDPSSIGKNVPVDIPIVGDTKHVLADLIKAVKAISEKPDHKAIKPWWDQIKQWQGIDCLRYDKTSSKAVWPRFISAKILSEPL